MKQRAECALFGKAIHEIRKFHSAGGSVVVVGRLCRLMAVGSFEPTLDVLAAVALGAKGQGLLSHPANTEPSIASRANNSRGIKALGPGVGVYRVTSPGLNATSRPVVDKHSAVCSETGAAFV